MEKRKVELNGGLVKSHADEHAFLKLPPTVTGYANAQIDDYGFIQNGRFSSRKNYPWQQGTRMRLRACFSHPADELKGTAGFGFWNAPWGDPTIRGFALPQAAWFFCASPPNHLPFAPAEPGHGWFAATMDAATSHALLLLPIAPLLLLLNQPSNWRRRLWPKMQHRLGISHANIQAPMQTWHNYELVWQRDKCIFKIDEEVVLQTRYSPKGPLGFVCWIDNQFLVATANGRFQWGTLSTQNTQWLEITDLQIQHLTQK